MLIKCYVYYCVPNCRCFSTNYFWKLYLVSYHAFCQNNRSCRKKGLKVDFRRFFKVKKTQDLVVFMYSNLKSRKNLKAFIKYCLKHINGIFLCNINIIKNRHANRYRAFYCILWFKGVYIKPLGFCLQWKLFFYWFSPEFCCVKCCGKHWPLHNTQYSRQIEIHTHI